MDNKVFVIDDDAAVRTGLTRLLRTAGYDIEVFESADKFLQQEQFDGIGCLVLDLRMPGMSGIELQQRLDSLQYKLPIVFLSGHADIPDSVQAMKHGAVDFLTKPVDEAALLTAIESALARHRQQIAAAAEVNAIRQRIETLTPREFDTLQGVIAGLLNKQIAAELGIVEKTVKVHRARIMQKLGVTSVAELVRVCSQVGVEAKPPLLSRD